MNIGSVLTEAARRFADRAAIRFGSRERSYADWDRRASALGSALARAGVGPGDRVAILQQNGPELLESLFGIFKAGAAAVPINTRLHPEEYRFILEHSGASAVIFTPDFTDGLAAVRNRLDRDMRFVSTGSAEPWCERYEEVVAAGDPSAADRARHDDDLAWLFYTSGTTGRPKGAMITHGNLAFMCRQYPLEVRAVPPGEVVLHAAPLTHAGGLWSIPLVQAGAVHVVPDPPRFDPPTLLELVERERPAQIVFLAPTMLTMLLDEPSIGARDLSSVELIGYGGSPMYVEDLLRAIEQFGPVFCQIYGQGECPMTITMLAPADHDISDDDQRRDRLASAGRPRDGIDVQVLGHDHRPLPIGEVGEVAVVGPVVMKGYWEDEEATAEAFAGGWYHTGDLGRFDEDRYLYLLDRKKDLIITGGSNVYGREVEDVLLRHPDVHEVAVLGVPDRTWGEIVTAVVVSRTGSEVDTSELAELCAANLAGYKKPRRWHFAAALPKNGYGKVLKRTLREQLLASAGPMSS